MAELEDDLARLAPKVDEASALVALRSGRDRQRRRTARASALTAAVLVLGAAVLWQLRASPNDNDVQVGVTDSRPAGQPGEELPPAADPTIGCELTLVDRFVVGGAPGIVLRNDTGAACTAARVTAAGRTVDDVGQAIPNAAWNELPQREMPSVLDAGEEFSVILHNRPLPCPGPPGDEETGLFEMEVRIGRQRFAIAPDRVESWPRCGIAIAVLEELPTGTEITPDVVDPGWELVAQDDAVVDNGTLVAATSPEELAELWESHGLEAPMPEVDFADAVVVAVTIGNRGCPPELTGFEQITGGVFTPRFLSPPAECVPLDIPTTYAAILDRHFVGDAFVLRLPPQDPYYGEQRLTVLFAGGPPLCELERTLAISRAEPLFPNASDEEPSNDAFAVSFVNVSTEPCLIIDATARLENAAGDVVAVPQILLDPAAGLELPATVNPGRGFRAVFTHNIPPVLCDVLASHAVESVELMIGDRVVDISPGLFPGQVLPCGGFFRLEPTVPLEGVPGDPLDQRFRICLLSFPAQCNDPFIRPA
jgi:hypothetical protein